MKTTNQKQLKIRTCISLICCLIPLLISIVWISIFNLGKNQSDSVAIFKYYFPDFLNGRWSITLVAVFFCVLAMGISSTSVCKMKKNWKLLHILILILSSLLLLLNLFSML